MHAAVRHVQDCVADNVDSSDGTVTQTQRVHDVDVTVDMSPACVTLCRVGVGPCSCVMRRGAVEIAMERCGIIAGVRRGTRNNFLCNKTFNLMARVSNVRAVKTQAAMHALGCALDTPIMEIAF